MSNEEKSMDFFVSFLRQFFEQQKIRLLLVDQQKFCSVDENTIRNAFIEEETGNHDTMSLCTIFRDRNKIRELFFDKHSVNGIRMNSNIRIFIPSQYNHSEYIQEKFLQQDYDATSGDTLVVMVGQHHDETKPLELCSWKRLTLLHGIENTTESTPSTFNKSTREYNMYMGLIAKHIERLEETTEEEASRRCDNLYSILQTKLGDIDYYKYTITGPTILMAKLAECTSSDISSCYWLNG